jgi:UDP-glucose 4-epimerase
VSLRRALVTGGAGFIGSHLVEGLAAAGWSVRVLDDLSSGCESNLAAVRDSVELLVGDVRDPSAVEGALDGVSVVFHLGAIASVPASVEDPLGTGSVNLDGTLRVLEAARSAGAERVVLASSCAIYGDAGPLPAREDAVPRPASPYAVQKAAAELYAGVYTRLHGLATVALRYFNVYGPRQRPDSEYAAVIPRFVAACLEGKPPSIFGDGGQTRDFVSVDDAVRANLLAATRQEAIGGVFNVASGVETSIADLAARICEATGVLEDPSYSPARPGDVRRSVADPEAARERLGFEPEVALTEGLRRTVDAIRSAAAAGGRVA